MKSIFQFKKNRDSEKKSSEDERTLANVATSLGTAETVQRYGSAIAEDIVAYSGQRLNDDGSVKAYTRSHAKIGSYKLSEDNCKSTLPAQSGFSAEVNYVTQENKKNIIAGKNNRLTRIDDEGYVNHEVIDTIQLDPQGNIIWSSGEQMKFTGTPEEICKGIAGIKKDKTYTKYQGTRLVLPTEDIESTKKFCEDEALRLEKQASNLEASKPELAEEKRNQANELRRVKENIVDAGFSREQAQAYRLNPIKETVKSIGRTAHDAGVQGATFGAAIGGTISLASNVYALYQGDKKLGDAVLDCTIDTTKSVAMGYATGFAGATIKGVMEQSYGVLRQCAINSAVGSATSKATQKAVMEAGLKQQTFLLEQLAKGQVLDEATQKIGKKIYDNTVNKAVKNATKDVATNAANEFANSTTGQISKRLNTLSKTNLPALAVTVCLEFGGLVRQYAKGNIDGVEFMEKAGEKGVGMLSSSAMATIGQIAIPIPVVGAVIGGMIGYTLSSMFYNEALGAFKGAKEAHEEYLEIKARFEEAKRQRDIYQAELQRLFDAHMAERRQEFSFAFQQIDVAVQTEDMTLFSQNINQIGELFNRKLRFNNRNEFDEFMATDETFVL